MRILVIGSGGREHALVWKLAQSPRVTQIFCAPGNAGIGELAECVSIAPTDLKSLAAFAIEQKIALTVVGPEAPLCAGIADFFQERGLRVFGPRRSGAQLEGSKAFCKRFLLKHNIPTAAAEIFSDSKTARDFIRKRGAPIVVKADGLAAGKGVVVASTTTEAELAVTDFMDKKIFGDAGNTVVIEDCLEGEEASILALVDGATVKILEPSQDHKRVFDGDKGPNTGGMGAYSPTSAVPASARPEIEEIFHRTLDGLRADGMDYCGVLYAGLMMTRDGAKVLEFNTRFGDPETQVVVPRMDFDLLDVMEAVVEGRLAKFDSRWKREAAICVVLASGGYPGAFEKGKVINGLQEARQSAKVMVFHAGTRTATPSSVAKPVVVTDGGRVLGVTALGQDLAEAQREAYRAIEKIKFDGIQFRRDIAYRELMRK